MASKAIGVTGTSSPVRVRPTESSAVKPHTAVLGYLGVNVTDGSGNPTAGSSLMMERAYDFHSRIQDPGLLIILQGYMFNRETRVWELRRFVITQQALVDDSANIQGVAFTTAEKTTLMHTHKKTKAEGTSVNLFHPDTVRKFIENAARYQADRYFLLGSTHGGNLGAIAGEVVREGKLTREYQDSLTLAPLSQILASSRKLGMHLVYTSFMGCLLGGVERCTAVPIILLYLPKS